MDQFINQIVSTKHQPKDILMCRNLLVNLIKNKKRNSVSEASADDFTVLALKYLLNAKVIRNRSIELGLHAGYIKDYRSFLMFLTTSFYNDLSNVELPEDVLEAELPMPSTPIKKPQELEVVSDTTSNSTCKSLPIITEFKDKPLELSQPLNKFEQLLLALTNYTLIKFFLSFRQANIR